MLVRSGYPRMLFLGKDRERYVNALKSGNDGKYREMISVFLGIISEQRMAILEENLKKVIGRPRKGGQLRLEDFVKV